MTKQEIIRDKVIINIAEACPYLLSENVVALADKILQDEAAQGAVIQTGDVPEEYWTMEGNNIVINRIPAAIRQFLIEYKYKQVEPLI